MITIADMLDMQDGTSPRRSFARQRPSSPVRMGALPHAKKKKRKSKKSTKKKKKSRRRSR